MALEVVNCQPTRRPEIVEVTLAVDGRKVRLRRDMTEFYPGKVVVPLWLGQRIMGDGDGSDG